MLGQQAMALDLRVGPHRDKPKQLLLLPNFDPAHSLLAETRDKSLLRKSIQSRPALAFSINPDAILNEGIR